MENSLKYFLIFNHLYFFHMSNFHLQTEYNYFLLNILSLSNFCLFRVQDFFIINDSLPLFSPHLAMATENLPFVCVNLTDFQSQPNSNSTRVGNDKVIGWTTPLHSQHATTETFKALSASTELIESESEEGLGSCIATVVATGQQSCSSNWKKSRNREYSYGRAGALFSF